jgi:hypothetical protein
MQKHETKTCPRCHQPFECKPGNITTCQCYGITLPASVKAHIENKYTDCLCRDCLLHLQQDVNFFKEKFFSAKR